MKPTRRSKGASVKMTTLQKLNDYIAKGKSPYTVETLIEEAIAEIKRLEERCRHEYTEGKCDGMELVTRLLTKQTEGSE